MRVLRIPEPFDHSDWLYEVKFDGFREGRMSPATIAAPQPAIANGPRGELSAAKEGSCSLQHGRR